MLTEEKRNQLIKYVEALPEQSYYFDTPAHPEYWLFRHDKKLTSYDDFEDYVVDSFSDETDEIYDYVIDNLIVGLTDENDEFYEPSFDENKDRDDVNEIVWDNLKIENPIDIISNFEIKVNVICNFNNENDSCFTNNGWMKPLLASQGYDISKYPAIEKLAKYQHLVQAENKSYFVDENALTEEEQNEVEQFANQSKFCKTFVEEITEMHSLSEVRAFFVMLKMTIGDYWKLMQKKSDLIIKPIDNCGLIDMFNGTCGPFSISLEKDFFISSDNIYDIQVEGISNRNYTIDEICGLNGSCWKPVYKLKEREAKFNN